eukprot:364481-Chlamydomonas_euryale.AAC.16
MPAGPSVPHAGVCCEVSKQHLVAQQLLALGHARHKVGALAFAHGLPLRGRGCGDGMGRGAMVFECHQVGRPGMFIAFFCLHKEMRGAAQTQVRVLFGSTRGKPSSCFIAGQSFRI